MATLHTAQGVSSSQAPPVRALELQLHQYRHFTPGIAPYPAMYLIPLYLAVAHGYSTRQSGAVMAWIACPNCSSSPSLMQRLESRHQLIHEHVVRPG
jgi:hypothetical protein